MSVQSPWTTVLIESETLLRDLVAMRLKQDPRFQLVGEAADGPDGLDLCTRHAPHLLITEICLPGLDGIELAREVMKARPETRVLLLSSNTDPLTLARFQEAGIHGYVEKDQGIEILEDALVEVASGHSYLTAAAQRMGREKLTGVTQQDKGLSLRERDLLWHLLRGGTSREIATRLRLSPRSIETYRHRLMRKLGVSNIAALIELAYRRGLIHPNGGQRS